MSGSSGATASVQYRVVVAKGDERIEGPDDAEVVVTVPLGVVSEPGFRPDVEFMRGRLKASGHTGVLLDALTSGAAAATISRLAADG